MVESIPVIAYAVLVPVMGVFGYILRRALVKLDETMSEREIRILISDHLQPIYVRQKNIEHEMERIEAKLDKILDLLMHGNSKR